MASFAGALRALNEIKSHGVVTDYAVAGAMALVFWSEPIPTYDLDVLVWLVDQQTDQAVVNLGALYAWAAAHGHPIEAEHILIDGVPVRFLPRTTRWRTRPFNRLRSSITEGFRSGLFDLST